MDRLRMGLKAVGVPATDEDLERLEADGYLERVADTREILAVADAGGLPDYLALWDVGGGDEEIGRSARDDGPPLRQQRPDGYDGYDGYDDRDGRDGRDGHAGADGHDDRADQGRTHDREHGGLPTGIADVAYILRTGRVSPVELTQRALAGIEARDADLNLFQTVLAERAMDAARTAEQEIRRGEYRGPLHGVPVAVKDLLEMIGTVTTAGSKVRANDQSTVNAAAIERLEAAGAVILGKTRLSEFAYWPGSTNPHYGPTRNPRASTRDAGGSSSGSAAAVADGIGYGALGTDTGGSIRIPAALCGVVGLKPTFGRVSLFGCVPLAWSLDHLGPITRSVQDSALMLEALAGYDARDARTRRGAEFSARSVEPVPKGTELKVRGHVTGLRVGVLRRDGSNEPLGTGRTITAWRASNEALERAGATLVEIDLDEMHLLWRVSALMLATEAAAYHVSTLRSRYEDYGRFCRGRLLGAFAYGFEDMLRAQRVRRRIRMKWDRLFETIDVLSTPCQPDVAPALGVAASTRYTNPFNSLGWPAISVPFGSGPEGLPLGTQLIAGPWNEALLLRAARALEDAGRAG